MEEELCSYNSRGPWSMPEEKEKVESDVVKQAAKMMADRLTEINIRREALHKELNVLSDEFTHINTAVKAMYDANVL